MDQKDKIKIIHLLIEGKEKMKLGSPGSSNISNRKHKRTNMIMEL